MMTRFHEISFLCWPDFMRFRFCVDPISRCWPDFTWYTLVMTRFHEILFLFWPDFMRFRFCVDPISRCWFDFTRYTLVTTEIMIVVIISPHNTQPVCVLYVCAAEYSGRSHTGTRLSLLICCSKWLVMTQHPSTSFNHIESPRWCKHVY